MKMIFISVILLLLSIGFTTPVVADHGYTYSYSYSYSYTYTYPYNITSLDTSPATTDTDEPLVDLIEPMTENIADAFIENNSIPVAGPDSTNTELNTVVNIDILANDTNLDDLPLIVSILTPPENGQVIVDTDNTITYTPNNDFIGTDSLLYEVADIDGDKAIASIAIDVQCSDCPTDGLITLTWDRNRDEILGYAVYYGTAELMTTELISKIPLISGLIDPATPSMQYDLSNDLGIAQGDSFCFRLKAYNETGFSDYSDTACFEAAI